MATIENTIQDQSIHYADTLELDLRPYFVSSGRVTYQGTALVGPVRADGSSLVDIRSTTNGISISIDHVGAANTPVGGWASTYFARITASAVDSGGAASQTFTMRIVVEPRLADTDVRFEFLDYTFISNNEVYYETFIDKFFNFDIYTPGYEVSFTAVSSNPSLATVSIFDKRVLTTQERAFGYTLPDTNQVLSEPGVHLKITGDDTETGDFSIVLTIIVRNTLTDNIQMFSVTNRYGRVNEAAGLRLAVPFDDYYFIGRQDYEIDVTQHLEGIRTLTADISTTGASDPLVPNILTYENNRLLVKASVVIVSRHQRRDYRIVFKNTNESKTVTADITIHTIGEDNLPELDGMTVTLDSSNNIVVDTPNFTPASDNREISSLSTSRNIQVYGGNKAYFKKSNTATGAVTFELDKSINNWKVECLGLYGGYSSEASRYVINTPPYIAGTYEYVNFIPNIFVILFNNYKVYENNRYREVVASDITDIVIDLYGKSHHHYETETIEFPDVSMDVQYEDTYDIRASFKIAGLEVVIRDSLFIPGTPYGDPRDITYMLDDDFVDELDTISYGFGRKSYNGIFSITNGYGAVRFKTDLSIQELLNKRFRMLSGGKTQFTAWVQGAEIEDVTGLGKMANCEIAGTLTVIDKTNANRATIGATQEQLGIEFLGNTIFDFCVDGNSETVPAGKFNRTLADAIVEIEKYGGRMYEDRNGRICLKVADAPPSVIMPPFEDVSNIDDRQGEILNAAMQEIPTVKRVLDKQSFDNRNGDISGNGFVLFDRFDLEFFSEESEAELTIDGLSAQTQSNRPLTGTVYAGPNVPDELVEYENTVSVRDIGKHEADRSYLPQFAGEDSSRVQNILKKLIDSSVDEDVLEYSFSAYPSDPTMDYMNPLSEFDVGDTVSVQGSLYIVEFYIIVVRPDGRITYTLQLNRIPVMAGNRFVLDIDRLDSGKVLG